MGGWFRKEIKTVADLKGLKIPHRRHRRHCCCEARRRAAADSGRRHLPGARKGHDRRGRVGRPVRRREARLQQGREELLLPRLVGRRSRARPVRQQQGVGGAAEGLQGDPRSGVRRGQRRHDGEVRRAQSAGAEAAGRATASSCSRSRTTSWRRATRRRRRSTTRSPAKNAKFKKIYEPWKKFRADAGRVVPRRREPLRQLHDRCAADGARRSRQRSGSDAASFGGVVFCAWRRRGELRRRGVASLRFLRRRLGYFARPVVCIRVVAAPSARSKRLARVLLLGMRLPPRVCRRRWCAVLARGTSIWIVVARRSVVLLRKAAGDEARERDDEADHDDLDHHERHRAPVDLAGGDWRDRLRR